MWIEKQPKDLLSRVRQSPFCRPRKKRCQIKRNRQELAYARRAPTLIEQRLPSLAADSPCYRDLLPLGKQVDFDGWPRERHVESLTPRTDNDAQLREIAPESAQLCTQAFARSGVQLVPAVQQQNEATVNGQQPEVVLGFPMSALMRLDALSGAARTKISISLVALG